MNSFTKRRRDTLPDLRTPEEIATWDRVRAATAELRRQRREAGLRESYSFRPLPYGPHYGLKRGPKPDPSRECTDAVLTARVTKREAAELKRHHRKLCKEASPSTFFRFVLCQWLEAHRDKTNGSEPFSFDPAALDWRTRTRDGASPRGVGERSEPPRAPEGASA